MISYQMYKVIHIASIFLLLTSIAVLLLANHKSKFWKILTGVSSFFVLFAGMGLMARLGGGFQPWIQAKIVIWFIITGVGHLVAKRFPERGFATYWAVIVLAIGAASLAVYKPF